MKTYRSENVYAKDLPSPWYSTDDCFNENFNQQEEYILEHVLPNDQHIDYHIDSNGFRKANILESRLWFFGCSSTFGQSVEDEDIFPNIVSNTLGEGFYNFGTCGASVNLIARLLFKLRRQLHNKKIIIFLPPDGRFETFYLDQFINLVPRMPLYEILIPNINADGFLRYNRLYSTILIKTLLEGVDSLILSTDSNETKDHLNFINVKNLIVDRAIDNVHFGVKSHKNVARLILDHVKSR